MKFTGAKKAKFLARMARGRAKRIKSRTRRKNPSQRSDVERSAALFKEFTGHDALHVHRVRVPSPKAMMVVGTLDGIPYTAVRDGKLLRYMHWFKKHARPLLAASPDGRSLAIVGGRFRFTEAGIVDDKE
jgi:hypothetical protein